MSAVLVTDPRHRALSFLGLAARSGAVVTGTAAVREAVRQGSVELVLLAADASGNARSKLEPLLARRGIRWLEVPDRASLGAAVGKAPLSAVGVVGRDFGRRLEDLFGSAEAV